MRRIISIIFAFALIAGGYTVLLVNSEYIKGMFDTRHLYECVCMYVGIINRSSMCCKTVDVEKPPINRLLSRGLTVFDQYTLLVYFNDQFECRVIFVFITERYPYVFLFENRFLNLKIAKPYVTKRMSNKFVC